MSSDSLLLAARNFLRRHRLIGRGEQVIIAVSGGKDSMVLLDVLFNLRDELRLHLAVGHFNHRLRGADSEQDEAFVRAAAGRYGVECYVDRADTKAAAESTKRSVQDAARILRYQFLSGLRRSLGFQKIVTAHHADDNAETVLMNFLRGAGVQGLSGIPLHRRDIGLVRPLLCATREQIDEYAASKRIPHREDVTNAGTDYTRNFLRHEILPLVRESVNPNLTSTLQHTSEIFDELESFLEEESAKALPAVATRHSNEEIVIDLRLLESKPVFLREYILRRGARALAQGDVDFGIVRSILGLTRAETGSFCSVSGDVIAYRNRGQLVLRHRPRIQPYRYSIEKNRSYEFGEFRFSSASVPAAAFVADPAVEYVDASAIGPELVLRNWHDGDSFVPLGMRGPKKLSDFFVDEKVPVFEKQTIPILISGGRIVWICGKRLDDRFKVTPATTEVMKLEYQPRPLSP